MTVRRDGLTAVGTAQCGTCHPRYPRVRRFYAVRYARQGTGGGLALKQRRKHIRHAREQARGGHSCTILPSNDGLYFLLREQNAPYFPESWALGANCDASGKPPHACVVGHIQGPQSCTCTQPPQQDWCVSRTAKLKNCCFTNAATPEPGPTAARNAMPTHARVLMEPHVRHKFTDTAEQCLSPVYLRQLQEAKNGMHIRNASSMPRLPLGCPPRQFCNHHSSQATNSPSPLTAIAKRPWT